MNAGRKFLIVSVLAGSFLASPAQRTYKPSSVLATGNWYRVSTQAEGVYRMDLPFLNGLGITGAIPSASIRLYGTTGGMLPEANSEKGFDDLEELGIHVVDGGDGQLNGSDYILFFSPGPHQWVRDSANRRFSHRRNRYSDKAYYYLTISGTGKRISQQSLTPPASGTVTTFDERWFHELDTVNFLSSGKEWYGEEFANAPGKTLSRSFTLPFGEVVAGQPATLVSSVAARSINTPSTFSFLVNGQPVQQAVVPQVSTGQYDLFAQQVSRTDGFLAPANPSITVNYSPGSFNSQGWLNWLEVFLRRNLQLQSGKQLLFRDWSSVGSGSTAFQIAGADASAQIWEVTDPLNPVRMITAPAGGGLRFVNDASRLREYASFSATFLTPGAEGKIANQNLHATTESDYIIVSHPLFLAQAQRLAQFHRQRTGLRTVVVSTEQVYHEFGGGIADPTAIRDFVKMYYDRYRSTWTSSGKYLLLLGKASFDYKDRIRNNTSFVPAYQSIASLDPLATYTSDDFFGFLEDNEDINSTLVVNTLDIGIGRVPARTAEEARNFVDKVLDYHSAAALGPWRTNLNFIADDEDYNLHLQDAEILTGTVTATAPVFNPQKIYLDAFRQEGGSAGGRYPQANAIINNNIYSGTLIWNYSGHGGPLRLAEEVVIDQSIVNQWNNPGRLPLLVTATCDFAPYDNPFANSLGENLIVRPKTGAIALMTTTRVVFAFSNRILNTNYLRFALETDASGRYRTLGEAVQAAKNFTYLNSGDVANNRKFALLGDPAMKLGFPELKVKLTRINGRDLSVQADTLSAMEYTTVEGEITDNNGVRQSSYNGRAYLSFFDKPRAVTTLANDPTSQAVTFQDQTNLLFRGKATVQNGQFSIRFRVPRNINFQFGNGKASVYAEDGVKEGAGFSTNVVVGGISTAASGDDRGPEIRAYLNDERFVTGGIVNPSPVLLLKLFDSSGINTGSNGTNDLVATLDNNNNQYYVLNNFYESDVDDYQKGTVRFQMPALEPGRHTLRIKAWDVMNNSSEAVLDFIVAESSELRLAHVLNYPNPFSTRTAFWFEHNQPGQDLYAKVELFTVSGKLINTLSRTINTSGNRSMELEWDGLDAYGNKVARGVYLYRLTVRTASGKQESRWEKLVVL